MFQIFPGNTDQDSHKTNQLPTPVFARCVRIQAVSWQQHVSIRFDVLGCQCGRKPF
ncbi:hypothetical protein DPMN_076744 [Dreissena polymorpha]|uniref:F5/8 type C domain-containing protein n=1 Tax=Dreissena polymorpha TaxID=45954 RepID=A0A9D4BMN6_DREPO|nr:hypothetical protein DPMN_076744 [Dreissena polymorpha]